MKKLVKISLYFPTYNERDNILKVIPMAISAIKRVGFDYEIIIVDDNSPDKTAGAVKKLYKTDKKIIVIKRINERGYATAVRKGIENASGDWIGSFDADYLGPSTPLDLMLKDIKTRRGNFLVASRYVGMSGGMEASFRNTMSYLFNQFMKLLGYPLSDNMSGFFWLKKNYLKI